MRPVHVPACVAMIALLFASSASPDDPRTLFLDTQWRIQSSAQVAADGVALSINPVPDGQDWIPVTMPTTVLAALTAHGTYPDPYYGENLRTIPGYQDGLWLVQQEDSPFRVPWWYCTEFEVPADWADSHITLHFDGINYEANIWLNGTLIASREEVIGM